MSGLTKKKKVIIMVVACIATLLMAAGVAFALTSGATSVGTLCENGEGNPSAGPGNPSAGPGNPSAGPGNFDREGRSAGREVMNGHRDEVKGYIADTLGLSLEDLGKELTSGKTVAEIANSKGIPTDQMIGTVTEKVNEIVDMELGEGNLTQEQAERIKSNVVETASGRIQNGRGSGRRGQCGCGGGGRK